MVAIDAAHEIIPLPVRSGDLAHFRVMRPTWAGAVLRRRRLAPPAIAAGFTAGGIAPLSVVSSEVAQKGCCELAVGAIAGRAGVCASTVRSGLRQARKLGLLTVEERRLTYCRNLPDVVRIVSTEWRSWIEFRGRAMRQGLRPRGEGANQWTQYIQILWNESCEKLSEKCPNMAPQTLEQSQGPEKELGGKNRKVQTNRPCD